MLYRLGSYGYLSFRQGVFVWAKTGVGAGKDAGYTGYAKRMHFGHNRPNTYSTSDLAFSHPVHDAPKA